MDVYEIDVSIRVMHHPGLKATSRHGTGLRRAILTPEHAPDTSHTLNVHEMSMQRQQAVNDRPM